MSTQTNKLHLVKQENYENWSNDIHNVNLQKIDDFAASIDSAVIQQTVTDWLDDHPEATTTVQDGSITEEKLAQDVLAQLGEIDSLKTDISSAVEFVTYNYPINIKYIPATRGAITVSNTWSVSGNTRMSFMLKRPENAIEIVATASEEQGTYVCFLTNNTITHGAAVDYCTGTGRNWVQANETKRFMIPDDCEYINIFKEYGGIVYTPAEVYFLESLTKADTIDQMIETEEIAPSTINTVGLIVDTAHKWNTAGNSSNISVNNLKSVTVKSNDNNVSVVCFLKSLGANGDAVQYADNTGRNVIEPGETKTFVVSNDCKYINILRTANDIDYTPTKIWLSSVVSASEIIDMVERASGNEQYGLKCNTWYHDYVVATIKNGFDNPNNQTSPQGAIVYSGSGNLKASGFIPISGEMVEFPLPHTVETTYMVYGYCLYDKDRNPIWGRAGAAVPNRQEGEDMIEWTKVYIPKEAKYLRTTYWSDTARESYPDIPEFTYNLIKYPPTYEPITHELPVDMWMQNAIRRARQLTDIKWTPRVKIPRYSMLDGGSDHFIDWFYPDKEYVGIPYSGAGGDEGTGDWTVPKEWGYAHNWVGAHIPFESFVTAARYPNSILGETVDQTVPLYYSPRYGIVCTGLVNYTVNGPWPLRGIRNFFTTEPLRPYASADNLIETINLDMLMIGDFLYTAPHVIVITDLIRDPDGGGHVRYVEMSEATTVGNGNNNILGTKFGGLARRRMWNASEFQTRYKAYTVFRRKGFWGIPYYPSKYVDTGNEGEKINIVDFPCIPYLGNAAVYKVGYIHNSKILIGASGFTTLVVTKDGEAFGEFPVTGLTEVSVGFADAGYYEAYLTNGTTRSKACNWTVEA